MPAWRVGGNALQKREDFNRRRCSIYVLQSNPRPIWKIRHFFELNMSTSWRATKKWICGEFISRSSFNRWLMPLSCALSLLSLSLIPTPSRLCLAMKHGNGAARRSSTKSVALLSLSSREKCNKNCTQFYALYAPYNSIWYAAFWWIVVH